MTDQEFIEKLEQIVTHCHATDCLDCCFYRKNWRGVVRCMFEELPHLAREFNKSDWYKALRQLRKSMLSSKGESAMKETCLNCEHVSPLNICTWGASPRYSSPVGNNDTCNKFILSREGRLRQLPTTSVRSIKEIITHMTYDEAQAALAKETRITVKRMLERRKKQALKHQQY